MKCKWIVNGDYSSWFLLKGLWFTQKCLASGTKPTHISTIVFEDLCGCYKTLCPKCWRTGSFWEGCFVNAGSFEQQTRWDGQREPSTVLTAKQCHPQKHNEKPWWFQFQFCGHIFIEWRGEKIFNNPSLLVSWRSITQYSKQAGTWLF